MPNWLAARDGLPGDTNAVDKSQQINQLLTTHGITPVYQGNNILNPSTGTGVLPNYSLAGFDYDQPFTLSGTSIGRVAVPITPVGNGADLQVSLYSDSAGKPGTLLATTRIPAKWITSFAAYEAQNSGDFTLVEPETALPLALPQYNALRMSPITTFPFAGPATSPTGDPNPTTITAGNYMILVGGTDSTTHAYLANVFVIGYAGGTALSSSVPQPSLPQAAQEIAVAATGDTLVAAGGNNGSYLNNVYTASWDPNQGTVGSWSNQANLPAALASAATGAWKDTVYVVGGQISGSIAQNSVYWATVQNGQITAWNIGPTLPTAAITPMVAVVGNIIIVASGFTSGFSTPLATVYYSQINSDGSLAGWQATQSLPTADAGLLYASNTLGLIDTNDAAFVQLLTCGTTGPGWWNKQACAISGSQPGLFISGVGQWQYVAISILSGFYFSSTVYSVPYISVPLPVSGLTNGATYHVVLHQQGGDLNDFLLTWVEGSALPNALGESAPGANTWTYYSGYAIPLFVYNNTPGGPIWHTWEDSGERTSTFTYATTPDVRLLGIAESVLFNDGTCLANVAAIDYGETAIGANWPPIGVTQM